MNLIAGNTGDNRFIIAILEHWRAVFRGEAHFRSPNFFWPEQGVLGYSEPLFLFSIPYITARAADLDLYLAFELALIVFKAIGFFSMLWLLQSFLRLSRSVAQIGAALFTLSNINYLAVVHAQLVVVVFLPLLASLACAAWQTDYKKCGLRGHLYGGAFGLLLAGILFTSFYIGWFAILAAGLVIISALLIEILRKRTITVLAEWSREVGKRGWIFATAGVTFCLSILPFILTFLPTLGRTGGRTYRDNLAFTAHPIDLINIGQSNWLWGDLFNAVMMRLSHHQMEIGETQMGWPALTLVMVAAGTVLSFGWVLNSTNRIFKNENKSFLMAVLALSLLVGWLLSIKVDEQSLWWLIFRFVPGGSAVRVPARFNIVLNLFVVVVTCLVLNLLRERWRLGRLVFWPLSLLIIAEQINTAPVHLIQRDIENAILMRPQRLPSSCISFFLTVPASSNRPFYADHIDAMLIARMNNVPTIDGYSGWSPADWHLDRFDQDYFQSAKSWVLRNHITNGFCGLDLQEGSWSPISLNSIPYYPGSVIDFHRGGNAHEYETQGWGVAEETGTWALGDHSSLSIGMPKPTKTDLLLTFVAHALLPLQRTHFRETLRVNGKDVADWSITETHFEKRVRIPLELARSRSLEIDFVNHDPRSPADLGISTDNRKLGFALEDCKLIPVSLESDYLLGSDIDFTWGGNAYMYEKEGWSAAETGGSWGLGEHSILTIPLQKSPTTDLILTIRAHALISPKRPHFREILSVNNILISTWSITNEQFEKRVHIPRAVANSGLLKIDFSNNDPRSPADLGLSTDNRKLGFAVETLKLEAASEAQVNAKH